jgi:hypothetical protein
MNILAEKLIVFTEKATVGCIIPNFLLRIGNGEIRAVTKDLSGAAATEEPAAGAAATEEPAAGAAATEETGAGAAATEEPAAGHHHLV